MVHSERTFWRRNQSRIAFCTMRWKSSGSSAAGRCAVLLGEPQHRVLHDVERRFLVAHGEHRLLERAPLDALQERRKLAARCQGIAPLLFGRAMVSKGGAFGDPCAA